MSKKIGDLLERTRIRAGMTKTDVARAAGISRPSVISAEAGHLGTLRVLERHLHVLGLELRVVRPRKTA